ncbi:hypothetical protein CR513_46958, partial [Mucuna pruriens]
MGEIRARVEKHIEAEEDQADRIHSKGDCSHPAKTHHRQGGKVDAAPPNSPHEGETSTNPPRGLPYIIT